MTLLIFCFISEKKKIQTLTSISEHILVWLNISLQKAINFPSTWTNPPHIFKCIFLKSVWKPVIIDFMAFFFLFLKIWQHFPYEWKHEKWWGFSDFFPPRLNMTLLICFTKNMYMEIQVRIKEKRNKDFLWEEDAFLNYVEACVRRFILKCTLPLYWGFCQTWNLNLSGFMNQ